MTEPSGYVKISAYVWPHGGGIICEEKDCPHSGECANHESAGDFRTGDGPAPFLIVVLHKQGVENGLGKLGDVLCSTRNSPGYFHDGFTEDDDQHGMVNIKDLGGTDCDDVPGSMERHMKKCATCNPSLRPGKKQKCPACGHEWEE